MLVHIHSASFNKDTAMFELVMFVAVVGSLDGAKQCNNLHPGLSKIIRGVDITTLDLLPLQVVGQDGVMSPVFQLTCDQGKVWRSPTDKIYQMPDQIWHITSIPGGWLSSAASTYRSYNEVRNSMSVNVGLEANIKKYGFSASFSYKKMQSSITSRSKMLTDVTAFAGATRVDVIPSTNLELDNFTRHYIDTELTGTFETNPAAYNQFIATYGTHYFDTANFGGVVRMLFEISKEYFMTRTEQAIEASAKASYMIFVSASVGVSTNNAQEDRTFISNSKRTIKYYGGNTNFLNSQDGFSKWQPTVEKDPWLFSGKLKPISDLIKDPTKKVSMVRAVKNHVLRSYLVEMESLIETRAMSNNAIVNSFLGRLRNLKNRNEIHESAVDALSRDLEEYVSVPQWFVDTTKICLHWWGTSDWGQCGPRHLPRQLCANVNQMTSWYSDMTDNRRGGCRMQWSIFSTKSYAPAWLSNVKICYQWYAERDIYQCGGDRGKTFCSNVNSYTQEYLDDTGSRSGGCQMRWMIQVPDNAPYWMKAVQMCYHWEAEGDARQCGGGAPPQQCVLANQWTQYYLDYTDNRPGGCKMRWGLKTSY